jgi:hypothetical protein
MARIRTLCVLMALGALLAACKHSEKVVCPPLLTYSTDFLMALDREVASLDAPYLFQIMNDYGVKRDAIRKCIKARGKKK